MMIALAGIIGAPSVAGFQRRHRWRRFFLGLRLASAHIRHLERNPGMKYFLPKIREDY